MVVVTGTANGGNDANSGPLTRRGAQCAAGAYESLDATNVAIGNVSDASEEMDHRIDNTSERRAMVQTPGLRHSGRTKMAKRTRDGCGKRKELRDGKTCEKGHFICQIGRASCRERV